MAGVVLTAKRLRLLPDSQETPGLDRFAHVENGQLQQQITIENVYVALRDLLANPRRRLAARRIHFAVKRQSQA
ncbi:MAG: hypothetical protein LBQ10_04475 [Desulfovibrio sp.]|jgi:hypothetical protein|nr:hypothetical protein [Desulfovibrio sp.]